MASPIRTATFGLLFQVDDADNLSDTLPRLATELAYQLRRQANRFPRHPHRSLINQARRMAKGNNMELKEKLLRGLEEAMGEFTPPYGEFCIHDGWYGYWLQSDWHRAMRANGVLEVKDLGEVPRTYHGEVLIVNDHGNATFGWVDTRGKFHETWAIV